MERKEGILWMWCKENRQAEPILGKKNIEKLANVPISTSCRITVYIGTTVFAVSIERGWRRARMLLVFLLKLYHDLSPGSCNHEPGVQGSCWVFAVWLMQWMLFISVLKCNNISWMFCLRSSLACTWTNQQKHLHIQQTLCVFHMCC